MDRFSLAGKTAIITGATRGIGLAIAGGYLEAGGNVVVCSRKQENVDQALSQLQSSSDSLLGIACHVGKPDDVTQLVDRSVERFGGVDILVNNAGTNPYFGPIIDSDETAWDKTMDVNLKGPYMLSKACGKEMVERGGGSIINVSSVAGLTASSMQGIYSVSKAALIMLTKVLARELGSKKIRANCICPGLIKTQLSQALWQNEELEKSLTSMKALGRIGTTDELVGAAIYYASDASSFTTGSVIQVDGGMVI